MELRGDAVGMLPDQVLVLETVGSVDDFVNAVRKVDGLEWLAEADLSDLDPDDDFRDNREGREDELLPGRLFLVMTDAGALTTLRLRFDEFRRNPDARFPGRLAPLKHVFEQLRTVRFWEPRDRLAEFGLFDDWRFRLRNLDQTALLPFEAELWFRRTPLRRQQAEARFRNVVSSLGGEISQSSVIPEISYHAVLGRIPANRVSELVGQDDSELVMCEEVMFLRPVGQFSVPATDELADLSDVVMLDEGPTEMGEPVVALFDGLPLTGHRLLDGRLVLDDPDGYEERYQANQRHHGTGMASLICHGELDGGEQPLNRRLYTRPVLRPVAEWGGQTWTEKIPEEELAVDLIHRAVRRLFDGDGTEPPVAPGVRIINLSVCDQRRPFVREMSPLARLLDWLAFKYGVLFLVSAGNHGHAIELNVPRNGFAELDSEGRASAVFNALAADTRNRSLLSPSETLNGLTVGATHSDLSEVPEGYRLINPFNGNAFPSVVSAHGPGHRRSVKPEVMLPGGRQSLAQRLGTDHDNAILEIRDFITPPGQRVAWPGEQGGLEASRYTRGTSNATALASRAASRLYDVLCDLRSQSAAFPSDSYDAVLLKALLVHGAHCERPLDHYASLLGSDNEKRQNKEVATRLIGYGASDTERAMFCTDHRVTVVGCGEIGAEDAHTFHLPAPPGLSGMADPRWMITTLAWLSPINCSHRNYRRAQLGFRTKQALAEDPVGATNPQVRRGTVQHEVRQGRGAKVVNDGDQCEISIECRADAGDLDETVRYALVVTLEVEESVDVLLYEEIRDRLLLPTPVRINP